MTNPENETLSLAAPVPEPCLDSFVFLRVKERQENILVEPETDDQRCIIFPLSKCVLVYVPTRGQCCLFFLPFHTLNCWCSTFPHREYVVDLEEGSQHLMRYRTIAPLISSGAVQLI